MIKIKEWVVVEGKADTANLKKYYDVSTIETNGYYLSKEKIEEIKQRNNENGVIIFTDPDSSGNSIRKRINESVKGCKNAYIRSVDGKHKNKVGIEHASFDVLDKALSNLITFKNSKGVLTLTDLVSLKLTYHKLAKINREKISQHFNIGDNNAKSLLNKLNQLEISYNDIKEVLDEQNN